MGKLPVWKQLETATFKAAIVNSQSQRNAVSRGLVFPSSTSAGRIDLERVCG